ncbi:gamma-glutamyl-gamma-aminobutyrate hydrolase family protein [Methylobacterium sp. JK268]
MGTRRQPRIAVILDENTSGDGNRYEAAKGYFRGVALAGGLPFGIPYLPDIVSVVLAEFDGLVSVGGRFAYPDEWYLPGEVSKAPPSDRFAVERAIVAGCLHQNKPVLGICAGMQMLACLHGGRLTPDLRAMKPDALDHDRRGATHTVTLVPGSRLAAIVGQATLKVNTFHREAVAELPAAIVASAYAPDGIVEAVEVPGRHFAIGIQWHQELLTDRDHPGNRLFQGFVEAARSSRSGS